jgi:hypothetical protein|nr:MAG TPA: hypothetical protein [Caudoviricetes sp.]
MILYTTNDLKIYETRSDKPNEDWTGEAEFVIDETSSDNAELIKKIKEFAPYFDYVKNDAGELVDVIKTKDFIPLPSVDRVAVLESQSKQMTAQISALETQNSTLEECIVEMAGVVYA